MLKWFTFILLARGSRVAKYLTCNPVVQGYRVRTALNPLGFHVEVSIGKTLQSPSLVPVKPRKDMNNVSCRCDMTEILLKAG